MAMLHISGILNRSMEGNESDQLNCYGAGRQFFKIRG